MELWKWISLHRLEKISKDDLIPNQRYIMHSITKFWPNSRRLIIFKQRNGQNHVDVDVEDIILFKPFSPSNRITPSLYPDQDDSSKAYWMGNNRTIQSSGFDFYEYPLNIEEILEVEKMDTVSQSIRSHIPSLEQLSRSAVSNQYGISMEELGEIVPNKFKIRGKTMHYIPIDTERSKSRGGKTKRKKTKRKKVKGTKSQRKKAGSK